MKTIGAERQQTTEGAVILGVDTHLDLHVAVALDRLGRRLGEASVPTTAKGYEESPYLGGGLRPRRVRRSRRHQLLRGRAHSAPEGQADRGFGGGAPRAPEAKLTS